MSAPRNSVTNSHAFLAAFGAALGILALNIAAAPLFPWLDDSGLSASLQLGFAALVSEVGLTLPLILVVWLARLDLRDTLGLHRFGLGPLLWSLLAVIGAGILLDELMFLAVHAVPALRTGRLDAVGQAIADATLGEALVMLVPLALLPALCEEALCRGVVLRGFLAELGRRPWVAVALSSIFFGILHLDWLHAPIAALMGLLFGLVAVRTGSLWPAVICHLLNNVVSILTPALGGPTLIQMLDHGHSPWVVVGGGALLALGLVGLLRTTRARPAGGEKLELLEQEEHRRPADADHGE